MAAIKWSTTTASNTVKIKNFVIGNDNVPYGSTSDTGFWKTIDVPSGGYVIYGNKASQGPSIYVPLNDTELINTTNAISGQTFATFSECIDWFDSQNDTILLNADIPNITTSGLVLYLDAGVIGSYNRVSDVWKDISGNTNNGTVSGATWSNNYFTFDGVDDHIVISNSTSLSFGSTFSLEFWVYPTDLSTRASLFTTRPYSQNSGSFTFELGNGNGGTNSVVLSGVSTWIYRSNPNIVALNYWNHVSFVRNGNSSAGVAYVNGLKLISSETNSYTISNVSDDKFIARPDSTSNYFAGRIGESRIYNQELSQARIIQNYKATRRDYVVTGASDKTLNIGSGINGFVNGFGCSVVILPDDRVLLSGNFTQYNGLARNRIVMINSDGTLDTTFSIGTGFNDAPWVAKRTSTGQFLLGGLFTSYNGASTNYLVRLNANGTRDTNFAIGSGPNFYVFGINTQSTGRIILTGYFNSYNGNARNFIVGINQNGSIDNTFSIGTGFNNVCIAHELQSDDKVLVMGFFSAYNGTSRNRFARINANGSIDTGFTVGTGFNSEPYALAVQPDGKIIVVGAFTSYNNTSINRIVRLNSNGTIDTSFSVGTGFNDVPFHVILDGSQIIVSGNFSTYNNLTARAVVRLNSDGSIGATFSFDSPGTAGCTLIHSNGNYLSLGLFTSYAGASQSGIVRLEA